MFLGNNVYPYMHETWYFNGREEAVGVNDGFIKFSTFPPQNGVFSTQSFIPSVHIILY